MLAPLYLAVFFFVCAAGAYGIQKRKRWAWYCGWVFMFFSASALAMPLVLVAMNAESVHHLFLSLIGLIGGLLLWCGWAIWWSRRQREFGINPHD